MTARVMNIRLVGVTFCDGYPETFGGIEASWVHADLHGQERPVILAVPVRDPGNEHDPNAIGIYVTDGRVGYIPASTARVLAPLMDDGQQWTGEVTAIITDPDLPATPGITVRLEGPPR